jgi:hypothetical protein
MAIGIGTAIATRLPRTKVDQVCIVPEALADAFRTKRTFQRLKYLGVVLLTADEVDWAAFDAVVAEWQPRIVTIAHGVHCPDLEDIVRGRELLCSSNNSSRGVRQAEASPTRQSHNVSDRVDLVRKI